MLNIRLNHGFVVVNLVGVGLSPKFLDTQNVCCNHPKIQTKRSFHRKIYPKDGTV